MALYSIWGKVGESFEKWFYWGLNYSYSWCMLDKLVSDLVLDCCFMFSASIFFYSFVKFDSVVCEICLPVVISWLNIIEFILYNCIHNSFCCNADLWFYEDQFDFYIFWKTFPSAPRESPTFCFLIYSYQNFASLSLSFSH